VTFQEARARVNGAFFGNLGKFSADRVVGVFVFVGFPSVREILPRRLAHRRS